MCSPTTSPLPLFLQPNSHRPLGLAGRSCWGALAMKEELNGWNGLTKRQSIRGAARGGRPPPRHEGSEGGGMSGEGGSGVGGEWGRLQASVLKRSWPSTTRGVKRSGQVVDRMGCVWGTSSSIWGTDVRAVVKRLTRTPASYSTHSRVILYNGTRSSTRTLRSECGIVYRIRAIVHAIRYTVLAARSCCLFA